MSSCMYADAWQSCLDVDGFSCLCRLSIYTAGLSLHPVCPCMHSLALLQAGIDVKSSKFLMLACRNLSEEEMSEEMSLWVKLYLHIGDQISKTVKYKYQKCHKIKLNIITLLKHYKLASQKKNTGQLRRFANKCDRLLKLHLKICGETCVCVCVVIKSPGLPSGLLRIAYVVVCTWTVC